MSVDCMPAAYNEGLTSHLSPIPLQFSSSRKYLQFAGHSVALFQSASLLTFYKQAHHSFSLNLQSSEEAYLNYNKSRPVEAVSYSSFWLQHLTDLTCTSTAQASPVISNSGKHLLPTQTPELQELLLLVDCSDRIRKKKLLRKHLTKSLSIVFRLFPSVDSKQTSVVSMATNSFLTRVQRQDCIYQYLWKKMSFFFFPVREVAQLKLMRHNTKRSQGSKCCKCMTITSTVPPSFRLSILPS